MFEDGISLARLRVYTLVEEERQAQERVHGSLGVDILHSPNDWLAIVTRHLGLAANDRGTHDAARFKRQLIRVAATAIAALEAQGNDLFIAGPDTQQRGSQL